MNEFELVYRIQNGCAKAKQQLDAIYTGYLYALGAEYYGKFAWYYSDIKEVQILVKMAYEMAVVTYNQDKGAKFYTHLYNVAKYAVLNDLRSHKALGDRREFTFSETFSESYMISDSMPDETFHPYKEIIIDDEINKLKKVLGDDIFKIIKAKNDGYSYDEISEMYNLSTKQIDNTIQKARRMGKAIR